MEANNKHLKEDLHKSDTAPCRFQEAFEEVENRKICSNNIKKNLPARIEKLKLAQPPVSNNFSKILATKSIKELKIGKKNLY